MTSRLTLAALAFSIVSTGLLVWSAEADTRPAPAVRYVQLEKVTIVAPRLVASR